MRNLVAPTRHPRWMRGFSLLELLIGVAILCILVSVAAAPFHKAIERHRIASVRTELLSALQWARWEALRRNTPITLLRRTDCSTPLHGADDWHCGWDLAAGPDIGRSSVLQEGDVLQSFRVPSGLRLTHPGGGPIVQFASSGYPVLVAHRFNIGPPAPGSTEVTNTRHTATLCMNRTGRVRTVEGQTSC